MSFPPALPYTAILGQQPAPPPPNALAAIAQQQQPTRGGVIEGSRSALPIRPGALDQNALAPIAPKRGGFWNTVGEIGDVLAEIGGEQPIYGPRRERRREEEQGLQFQNALSGWLQDPQNPEAFVRMAAVSPEHAKTALELRADDQRWRNDRIDQTAKTEERAMAILGSAHDQPSYDRARAIVGRLFGRFGVTPDDLGLPEGFSPELVNEVRLRGTLPKDQLDDARLNRRLDWDIDDDRLDNERLSEREADLARDRTARRAQAQRQAERRDATTRRGQDLTDSRVRSGAGRGSGGSRTARPTATGPNGQKVEWDGKAWVPVRGR